MGMDLSLFGLFGPFPGFYHGFMSFWAYGLLCVLSGVLGMDLGHIGLFQGSNHGFYPPLGHLGVLGMDSWPNWDLFWVIPKVLGMDMGLLGIDYFPGSLDYCPMPINVDQCRSKSWH